MVIIRLLGQNDKEAIKLIYQNYSPVMMNIILRVVKHERIAEDVLQEALLKIWNNRTSYDTNKGSLFTWMTRISRNAAIDKTRTKDFRLTETSMNASDIVSISDTQAQSPEVDEMLLAQVVERLPEKQRLLIDLAYFQGYTQKEIAEKFDIPLGTVKTRMRAAITNLREII